MHLGLAHSTNRLQHVGALPSLLIRDPQAGQAIPTCPIRAHSQDLEHFETFGDFAESITYAGTTRRCLPTPPASTIILAHEHCISKRIQRQVVPDGSTSFALCFQRLLPPFQFNNGS